MRPTRVIGPVLLGLGLACGGGYTTTSNNPNYPNDPGGTPVQSATVRVQNDLFSLSAVNLYVGGTVTWVWEGQSHSVTSVLSPSFGPNAAVQSAPYTHGPVTFPTAGTYRYICTTHGSVLGNTTYGMAGAVFVQ